MKKIILSTLLVSAVLLFVVSCSKQLSLEEAQSRVTALKEKGVPDNVLSSVNVYLYQMKAAKKSGNTGLYRVYRDSLSEALDSIELSMAKTLESGKVQIDSLRKSIIERKATLKGLHLKSADSVLVIADSLIKATQPILAHDKFKYLANFMDTLVHMQKTADSLRPMVVGTWVIERESPNKKLNVVERREIRFKKDGSLWTMEKMKGRSGEYLKEDWEFQSKGKWDMKGMTIYQYINKEKCLRQNYWNLDPKTNKWKKIVKPTYDSTYTNGSKDRYIDFDILKKDYKYFKRT